ncbi:MAG: DNA translocase FtsK [Blastocatellales bacterium]|nr:DNA translocase FtsK [Blastocatellales bacterium]
MAKGQAVSPRNTKKLSGPSGPSPSRKRLGEIGGVVLLGLGIVTLLALVSYNQADPSWNSTGPQLKAQNWIGPVGALLADALYQAFGYMALVTPLVVLSLAARCLPNRKPLNGATLGGMALVAVAVCGLLALAERCTPVGAFHSGGWLGHVLACDPGYGLTRFFNTTGSVILLVVSLLIGLLLATRLSLVAMVVHLTPREREAGVLHSLTERFRARWQERQAKRAALRAAEAEAHSEPEEIRFSLPPVKPEAKPEIKPEIKSEAGREPKPVPKRAERREDSQKDPGVDAVKEGRKGRLTMLGLTEAMHEVFPLSGSRSDAKDAERDAQGIASQSAESEPPAPPAIVKAPANQTTGAIADAANEGVRGGESSRESQPGPETPIAARAQAGGADASSNQNAGQTGTSPGSWRSRLSDLRRRGRSAPEPPAEEITDPFEDSLEPGPLEPTAPASEPEPVATPQPPEAPEPVKAPARFRYSDMARRDSGERTVEEMVASASVHRPVIDDEGEIRPVKPKPVVRAAVEFKFPQTQMLTAAEPRSELAEDELRDRAAQLAEKCREFNVTGVVKQILPGPVVTTFEFKLDPGVKYGRVTSLVDDLCLGMKAESIRIDRIPGKSTVGIEVPNKRREVIRLREVLESQKFRESVSKLTIALGKTIDGSHHVADLAKMPHLLIAGATGAGKSVALNTILVSLLYKAAPEDVKFILIDPKRLELGLYADIPHLLTPIVTDPKRASYALKWAVTEMENRYRHLASFGVRNIDQYNQEVGVMIDSNLAEDSDELPKPLPYIVIIIDELADLMMVSARDVEESITRLAQMARAVGIHLVLATQRPSTDVITGLIKANFPSRISFRVSSKVDSRVIIDANGAEGLLGQGDMLFLPPGTSRLIRVHGAFVDEKEVKRIADFVRAQRKPVFDERIQMSEKELEGEDLAEMRRDEKYEEALRIVFEMGRASTSVLQRRLRIGYGRAASIIDMMHREGVVGPEDGSKPRQVLVSPDDRTGFLERLKQMREDDN